MRLKINSRVNDELYMREEIKAEAEFEGRTPLRTEIKGELSKKSNADKSLMVIRKITQAVGERKAYIHAYLYKNKEAMKKVEQRHMLSRNTEKKAEKAPEGAADEKKSGATPAVEDKKEAVSDKSKENTNNEEENKKEGKPPEKESDEGKEKKE